MATLSQLLGASAPTDHARQTRADGLVARLLAERPGPLRVLDLGCGVGRSRALFDRTGGEVEWVGVDIIASPEVLGREQHVPGLVSFDGLRLPFAADVFDLVFSRQVLEHVRHPQPLLADVRRVLCPNGVFVGSTSHLEPFHSQSVWNFTPYGFKLLAEDAGFCVTELRAGIDGVSLTNRAFTGDFALYDQFFGSESPLNQEIDQWGMSAGRSVRDVNVRKLAFCGHFSFVAVPDPEGQVRPPAYVPTPSASEIDQRLTVGDRVGAVIDRSFTVIRQLKQRVSPTQRIRRRG